MTSTKNNLTIENYQELVALTYDAVFDPLLWQSVLEKIVLLINGQSGSLYFLDPENTEAELAVSTGSDLIWRQRYRDYYHKIDPFYSRLNINHSTDIMLGSDLIPQQEFIKTEFYNDYYSPQDKYYALGGVLWRENLKVAYLGIQRPKHRVNFSKQELQTIKMFIPHLQRASKLRNHIADDNWQHHQTEDVLNKLSNAVLLLDTKGMPYFLNRAAERLLDCGGLVIRNNQLHTAHKDETLILSQIIRQVTQQTKDSQQAESMMLQLPGQLQPCSVIVMPTQDHHFNIGQAHLSGATLFINIPQEMGDAQRELLVKLFGFSPAEAQLATELVNGYTLNEIVDTRHVSLHTLRTQLKGLFRKSGCKRQMELVKLILTHCRV